MAKKKSNIIDTVIELESELKKVYDRTEPDTIHQYISDKESKDHRVNGCHNCPFARVLQLAPNKHSYCIWDGSMSDISAFVDSDSSGTPADCPLQKSNITVTLNGDS